MPGITEHKRSLILVAIVVAQFFCTSVWFAGNAVVGEITRALSLQDSAMTGVTMAVQLGFIFGTLVFAITKVADRFNPSNVFMICAVLCALANMSSTLPGISYNWILLSRVLTGFFLAGIYPVGMKIASDYYEKGLGVALGYLVGALVLGTASSHLVKDLLSDYPWQWTLYATSSMAILGGLLVGLLIKPGPYRKSSQEMDFQSFYKIFRSRNFSSAAVGYFGHMWELYAFWAFIPVYIHFHNQAVITDLRISFVTFLGIGVGALSCILGGYLSRDYGSKLIASTTLTISVFCCIISPWMIAVPHNYFIMYLLIWGAAVIADSPQFSTLVAKSAPAESSGTGLTIVNSLGFALTIISIQLLEVFEGPYMFWVLIPGPILGLLIFVFRFEVRKTSNPSRS